MVIFTPPYLFILNTMSNPWTASSNFSEQQIISVPSNLCEKIPYGRPFNVRLSSNEGPEQLAGPGG
jgi:hypothetical protein